LTELFNTYETPITDFKPIEKDSFAYHYLITKRGFNEKLLTNIYQANFWRNADSKEPIICFLNRRGNSVLGLQIRNMKDGNARFFKIYNYENLYKWLHGEEELNKIDISELVVYNKLSYYFGILNVDIMGKITIFEGYLDSLFYPNSIGVVGVNTDFVFLEKNLDIQYFFDNDTTGHKNSSIKLKNGFLVFLWNKLFKDIVDKKSTDDPYSLMHRISSVKDLNKLAQLVGGDPCKKLELDKYFSKDQYDAIWIPKQPKKEFKKYKKYDGNTNTRNR
jgi:hypothetical protein